MPMSSAFENRLYPCLDEIAAHFGTPFHIYDEVGIRDTGYRLNQAFAGIPGFREYFAVKALPNPAILAIMADMGFGFDCSSPAELILGRQVGGSGDDLMFTANNTTRQELATAMADGGSIVNLDDISLVDKLPAIPHLICFRYNPGERRTGNAIIGKPGEAKYGVSHDQLIQAYAAARDRGVKRFGLHTMLASNERDYTYVGLDASMSALMRPGMYNAYHHITVPGKPADSTQVVDLVGSLCENNDKFAIQRPLPPIAEGDRVVVHDTGAHGHAMGFNYNGHLRPKELLLKSDGSVDLIRREERLEDYFATLSYPPDSMAAKAKRETVGLAH